MDLRFRRPDMMSGLQDTKEHSLVVEILIFVGLFFLVSLGTEGIRLLMKLPLALRVGFPEAMVSATMAEMLLSQLFSIFLLLLCARQLRGRKAWTLGFQKDRWLREYAIGAGLGAVLISLMIGLGRLTGTFRIFPAASLHPWKLAVLLTGFLFQGMFEEALFRGYLIPALARKRDRYGLAILLSALLFAGAHLGNPGMTFLAFLNLTLFGIFAGVYFLKRGDLWGIGGLHALWNFTQGNFWGIRVSGLDLGPTVFCTESAAGSALLSGGSFGLEGGLLATLVLIPAICAVLLLPQRHCEA